MSQALAMVSGLCSLKTGCRLLVYFAIYNLLKKIAGQTLRLLLTEFTIVHW